MPEGGGEWGVRHMPWRCVCIWLINFYELRCTWLGNFRVYVPLYNTCCCGNAIVLGYTRHVILCERGSGGKIMRWRDGRDRGRGGGEKDGEGERRRERERERLLIIFLPLFLLTGVHCLHSGLDWICGQAFHCECKTPKLNSKLFIPNSIRAKLYFYL